MSQPQSWVCSKDESTAVGILPSMHRAGSWQSLLLPLHTTPAAVSVVCMHAAGGLQLQRGFITSGYWLASGSCTHTLLLPLMLMFAGFAGRCRGEVSLLLLQQLPFEYEPKDIAIFCLKFLSC